jgi:hypothetical protein
MEAIIINLAMHKEKGEKYKMKITCLPFIIIMRA